MVRKGTKVRIGISRITRPVWDKMLAAYRERPNIAHVMRTAEVGKKMARRAVLEGWPDHSMPPFAKLCAGGTSIHKEMAKVRESWDEAGITQGEAARQAAEEALAARTVMQNALRVMKMNQMVIEKIMAKFEVEGVPIPEDVTPKLLYQLTKSMDAAAAVVQKAMDVERKRMGEPEQVLGIQIGLLLDHCNETELAIVMKTGEVPRRLLDSRAGRGAGEDFSLKEIIEAEAAPTENGLPINETSEIINDDITDIDSTSTDETENLSAAN